MLLRSRDRRELFRAFFSGLFRGQRADLTAGVWIYPRSSAAAHFGLDTADPLVRRCAALESEYGWQRWREVLLRSVAEEALAQRIRGTTRCGWPLGSESFVKQVGQSAGRRLHPLLPGRPKTHNDRDTSAAEGKPALEIGG